MVQRAVNLVKRWRMWGFEQEHDVFKRPGLFKKRKVFACGCSDHSGMCHRRKNGDTARVERREKRRIIEAEIE
jgi:hypothetical protein